MRGLALTAVVLGLAATPAWADETVTTARTSDAHPPSAQAPANAPVDTVSDADRGDTSIVRENRCGGPAVNADGKPNTHPTGEVSVGVGTGRYREVGGAICQPIGENGAIAISAGQTQGQWGRR